MATTDIHPGTLYTPSNEAPPVLPQWAPRGSHRRTFSHSSMGRGSRKKGVMGAVNKFRRHITKQVKKMTVPQRIAVASLLLIIVIAGLLFTIYHEKIFVAFLPAAKKWRELPGGWVLIFIWCFMSAFPPLIGYSSSVTVAGFVYGFPHGWFVVAAATVIGSTSSFIACRLYFREFAKRILNSDARFQALALTLKHDGLKLLCMIRLTPLPYNFSNAALSALSVSPWAFAFATALATPKLLIHVYIGSALYTLAETGSKMSGAAKALNYITIILGIALGVTTGLMIYRRTMARAKQLEEQERAIDVADEDDDINQLFTDDDFDDEEAGVAPATTRRSYEGDNPIVKGRELVKDSFSALGGMFNVSDSEPEDEGRLLDGMESDVDAEELVVDDDTLELEDNDRRRGEGSSSSGGRSGAGGKQNGRLL